MIGQSNSLACKRLGVQIPVVTDPSYLKKVAAIPLPNALHKVFKILGDDLKKRLPVSKYM